jgi:hypothetical protein
LESVELERLDVELDPFVVNLVVRGLADSETTVQFYR